MDRALRALVRARAANHCEYCRLPQELVPLVGFHVEHVIPRQHGGDDRSDNLALACFHCNLHEGPNLSGTDLASGELVPLFHPRRERWDDHFTLSEFSIVGRTPTGTVTAHVLAMNAPSRLELRAELGLRGA
jgi:hypothetical protein